MSLLCRLLEDVTRRELLVYESMPSPHRIEGKFNVGDVAFDNSGGLGATPNNGNVIYMGATAWIKPSKFREYATASDRSETARELEQLMRQGNAIASPFLSIDIDGDPEAPTRVKVTGHEGRARSDAFKAINGDIPMPVHIFPSGLRSRDLPDSFFAWIEKHGMTAERSTVAVKPKATLYYCSGREVKP